MRKGILLTEWFRITELIAANELTCPVCNISQDLKQRFNGKNCAAGYLSACHPKVQLRCKVAMDIANKFTSDMGSILYEIEADLLKYYDLRWRDVTDLYTVWRESR